MSLRNNLMHKEHIEEIGKEFWGILSFETNLKGLYQFLELDKYSISIMTFANWVIFPEEMPPDIRNTIRDKLVNRTQSANYEAIQFIDLNEEEEKLYQHTNELIHFKYCNRFASPQRFHYLYLLPDAGFMRVLQQFQKYGYLNNDTSFSYYLHYQSLKKGE